MIYNSLKFLWIFILFLCIALALAVVLEAPLWLLLTALSITTAVLVVSFVLVLRPLQQLERYLNHIIQEEEWAHADSSPIWEVLPFHKQIEAIIKGKLREAQNIDALQAVERQTTLQALQSQINPHFLYNTLECIRGQALLDGNREIAVMLEALGNFFRYSISHRENIVTLLDELENIKVYMLIQNYRFSNRYQLKIDFLGEEEELLNCCVPKLILQPLIENALLHGFKNRQNGTIDVQVDAMDHILILTISDDGEGMSATTLQELNDKISGNDKPSQPRAHGIALPNVNRRIRMLFGKEYGLHAYSTPGRGTDIEIVLPRLMRPEAGI